MILIADDVLCLTSLKVVGWRERGGCQLGMEKADGHDIVLVGIPEMYLWRRVEFGNKMEKVNLGLPVFGTILYIWSVDPALGGLGKVIHLTILFILDVMTFSMLLR